MTSRNFIFIIMTTFFLALGQIFLKLGLTKIGGFQLEYETLFANLKLVLTSFYIWLGFIVTGLSVLLWMNVLSKVKLSIAYPMISLSYVFGLIFAIIILKENPSISVLMGTVLIMIGVFLVTR